MTFAPGALNRESMVSTLLTHGCPVESGVTLSVRFSSQQVSGIIVSSQKVGETSEVWDIEAELLNSAVGAASAPGRVGLMSVDAPDGRG